jgi:hypothetical protein
VKDHETSAAKLCRDSRSDGYTDWYLPSSYELLMIRERLHQTKLVDFKGLTLWSSTEKDDQHAWCVFFDSVNGQLAPQPKSWERFYCWPVRYFTK